MSLLITVLSLSSCSAEHSDHIVGEWAADNDSEHETILEFTDNGVVIWHYNGEDGKWSVKGTWTKNDDEESEYTMVFNCKTYNSKLENPMAEVGIMIILNEICGKEITLHLTKNGKFLTGSVGAVDGFEKFSSGSGKYDDIRKRDVESDVSDNNDESVEEAVTETCISIIDEPEETLPAGGNISMEHLVLKGNIDDYPISMELTYPNQDESDKSFVSVTGSYTYTKNGTSLRLEGTKSPYGEFTLNEFTKDGVNSGRFDIYFDVDGTMMGTFHNLINGKEFNVYLEYE
ncbi:MAG: hypothetical protein NC311_17860 [Muribaculaceae bacterium]|nr:hypothetical protein [Prevotella sp.]MCM1075673.1 hypothetical protein [Ruminococcus sp.]MCM1297407.1 hypothetical protein [Muribaculaceae bacterium]